MTRQPRSAGATLEGDERLAISIQEVIASKICKHLNIFLAFKMLHHGAQERSPLKKVLKCVPLYAQISSDQPPVQLAFMRRSLGQRLRHSLVPICEKALTNICMSDETNTNGHNKNKKNLINI